MINGDDLTSLAYLLDPCFQIVNTAGKPLTEGYIEVYYQGTRDKYYCSCDFDGTLLPFQIPLDSLGSNIVLASPDNAYDIYIYNKFGSLIMSRYNVKPGHGAGSTGGLTTITSSDNTVQIERTGNNYDLSIQDTIDRIDHLEDKINAIKDDTSYSVANGYGDSGSFVLTDKDTKDITYLNDMSGWRLLPGKVYQLNFNSKFTLDDHYNTLVEGKLYLDGDMSFSQDWSFSLDDSFDHIHHINGSTIIVVPDTVQYYDLSLKYTFNSSVNCTVELENISIVDITSIINEAGGSQYYEGDGIDITNNIISVDMDYINEQINIDEKLSSAINICNDYTDNSINEVNTTISNVSGDIINYVDNASGDIINYIDNSIGDVVDVIASATATLEQEIQDIPPQVQSDWEQEDNTQVDYIKNKPDEIELIAGQNIGLFEGNGTLTISASATDLSNCATHSEVYSATSSAVSSANSYTDTAIANLDLTPAVEIVSPNNTISVSSVVDSVNNTKTFYLDTNNPETNYWIGEANLTLSDQSSQGQVGYYKDVFDYTTRLNGNLDATKLKKGLYLLTANVMVVADEVNNDLAEIQIVSDSTSAISYTSSVFQHDCSVADYLGEPMDESHQIATIVRVMYDDTPMSLIARMDDPTTVSNELHLWFSDIGLYELQGTSVGGGSSPSASGSYDAGWGIVINGNVISVNPSIIPDVSNFATRTWVNNQGYLTSIPSYYATDTEVSSAIATATTDMATQTWVGQQGYLTEVPSQYVTETELSNELSNYALASAVPDVSDMATKTWVNNQGFITAIPSEYATDSEVNAAIATAINSIPEQVNADWNSTSGKSEILNKPETIDVDVCPIIAGSGISITASGNSAVLSCTVTGTGGESYSAGNGIDITNNIISIDNTVALKSEIPDVSSFITSTQASAIVGSVSATIENDIPDTSDMATKTWVGSQGYLTSIPSYYATDTEVANAIATAVSAIPSQVQSDWTEDDTNDPSYIQNKPETVDIDVCPIIAGTNITISASGNSAVISSTGGGGGSTYTAGTGIDITSDVISIDDSVVALKTDIPEPVSGASGVKVEDSIVSLDNPVGLVAGENITITVSGDSAIIAGQAGGGEDNNVFIAVPNTTNKSELDAAVAAGKAILCKVTTSTYGTSLLPMTRSGDDYVFMADTMNMASYGVEVGRKTIFAKYLNGLGWDSGITDSCVTKGELNSAIAGNTYSAGDGIEINSNVISVDDTKYISYEATGVMLANSNFEIDSNGRAYILSSQSSVINPVDYQYGAAFFGSGVTFPAGKYVLTVPLGITSFEFGISSANIYINGSANNGTATFVLDNMATSSGSMDAYISGNIRLESGVSLTHQAIVRLQEYITSAELQTVSAAIPDTSDMATQTWVGNQGYLTSIPSTYATDVEVTQAVTGATQNMVSYTGNTAINHIQLVSSLPASPDANTLYLITEA